MIDSWSWEQLNLSFTKPALFILKTPKDIYKVVNRPEMTRVKSFSNVHCVNYPLHNSAGSVECVPSYKVIIIITTRN